MYLHNDFYQEYVIIRNRMKNLIIPLVLILVLFSASLSLVMMNHMNDSGHSSCPLETVGITDCTLTQNPINFIISHLNALSNFSLAIPITKLVGLISLFLLLVFSSFTIFGRGLELFTAQSLSEKGKFRDSFVPPNRILFNHWFALHENSPALIVGR